MKQIEEEETNNCRRGSHLDSDWWRDRRITIDFFYRQNSKPHEFFFLFSQIYSKMTTMDLANIAATQHVATLLDDLITWRTVGQRASGKRFEMRTKNSFHQRNLSVRRSRNIEYPTAWRCLDAHRSFVRSDLILVSLCDSWKEGFFVLLSI